MSLLMHFCNAKLGNDKKNDKCERYAINGFSKLVRMGSPCFMLMNALYNLWRSKDKISEWQCLKSQLLTIQLTL